MEWPYDESGTYLNARIEFADLTGAQIRESRLNGVRFVVDSWFGHGVAGESMPYHPAGLPPAFMDGTAEMGIDTAASPTFGEVVDIWQDRATVVSRYLDNATADDLARICEPNEGPLWPPIAPGTAAIRCLRVVLQETWAHHQFAVRDLAIIDSPAPSANTGR